MRIADCHQSVPLDLTSYFNNKAFGLYPGEAAFDPLNQSYAALALVTNGSYTSTTTGINYLYPGYRGPSLPDNIICEDQQLPVTTAQYFSASFLVAADVELETVSGNVTFGYSDSTFSSFELRSEPWWAFLTINRGEIVYPYRFTTNGTNYNTSHVFEVTAALETGKSLTSISLPSTTNTTTGRLHVFAISLWQGSQVSVQSVRPTQQSGEDGTQLVEVTLNNAGTSCISGKGATVSLSAPNITTIEKAFIKRLCPGDQKRVIVVVDGTYHGPVAVKVGHQHSRQEQLFDVELGLSQYTTDLESLARHESPEWYNNAKYEVHVRGHRSVSNLSADSGYSSTGVRTAYRAGAIQRLTKAMQSGSGGTVRITRKPTRPISTNIDFAPLAQNGTTTTASRTTLLPNSTPEIGSICSPKLEQNTLC